MDENSGCRPMTKRKPPGLGFGMKNPWICGWFSHHRSQMPLPWIHWAFGIDWVIGMGKKTGKCSTSTAERSILGSLKSQQNPRSSAVAPLDSTVHDSAEPPRGSLNLLQLMAEPNTSSASDQKWPRDDETTQYDIKDSRIIIRGMSRFHIAQSLGNDFQILRQLWIHGQSWRQWQIQCFFFRQASRVSTRTSSRSIGSGGFVLQRRKPRSNFMAPNAIDHPPKKSLFCGMNHPHMVAKKRPMGSPPGASEI